MKQVRPHLVSSRIGVRAIYILALAVMLAPLGKAQYTISTIAGGGPSNGAVATSFGLGAVGVAVDAAGNLYVSSFTDNRVYKVDSAGNATVVAGNGGAQGYSGDGGPAISAQLKSPSGVAVDSAGNLYIADVINYRIRKVDTNGVITTVAGNGSSGYSGDGGPATSAQLGFPNGVAVDAAGNLYIADSNNYRVRKVANGVIATVAGNGSPGDSGDGGPATNAQLGNLGGVALDTAGNLYIADSSNARIRRVAAANGVISTVAGNGSNGFSGDGGQAASAQLNGPSGVVVDSMGNLYIADTGNQRIRKVATNGVIGTVAGNGNFGYSGDGGQATSAQLSFPSGVAVNSVGSLYIADYGNRRIRKVAGNGVIATVAGNGTTGYSGDGGQATGAQLNEPSGVAVDHSGNLYIAAFGYIRKVAALNGVISTVAGNGSSGYSGDGGQATSAQLNRPLGVAVDSVGNFYIADYDNQRIRKVAANGVISTVAGNGTQGFSGNGGQATSAQLNNPRGVAVDSAGNLFIVDAGNVRIRKVATNGVITTVAGDGSHGSAGDGGPAISAQLTNPSGVAVDSAGNVYIADYARIRKVDTNGVISTVAGGSYGYSGDGGPATSAQLTLATAVALDSVGNLNIADSGNSRVRKVAGNGVITTVAGNGSAGYSGDGGPATRAQLNLPEDLAIDSAGNVYVADFYNNRVRKLTPAATTIGSINPTSAPVGTPGVNLTVNGTNFVNGDIVLWNGTALTTTFVSDAQLTAVVPANLLTSTGNVTVAVAIFGGGTSAGTTFTITPMGCSLTGFTPPSPASAGSAGGNQSVSLTLSAGNCAWTAASNVNWITSVTPSGTGNGVVNYSVAANTGSLARTGVISFTVAGATSPAYIVNQGISGPDTTPPFGSFDTPLNNSTAVVGAIGVTGWALDNVGTTKVSIYRDPVGAESTGAFGLVLIGDAVFVTGARPDVQSFYPNYPNANRAGWGYQLLTNFLPASGNGTFRLHAIAFDAAGNTTELGAPGKTITCDNAHAAKPFGTIDTPGQGATASGSAFVNFGWALTPGANFTIPKDGSTIYVVIDGVPGPHPTYNQPRSDIQSLFPGYTNTDGAVGYYFLDTTKLTNGVHSISWNVFDNANRGEGIGSRYFTVANGTGNQPAVDGGQIRAVRPPGSPKLHRRAGAVLRKNPLDDSLMPVSPDATDRYVFTAEQSERLELHLGSVHDGYTHVGEEHQPLPAGSTLDPETGIFYWQPIAPFLGDFDLVFTPKDPLSAPVHVRVKVVPQRFE